jgi:hypothetical protein
MNVLMNFFWEEGNVENITKAGTVLFDQVFGQVSIGIGDD